MILSSPAQQPHKPSKIISLVPSQTELLYWLGLEEETIAITKFCVHPEVWFRTKTRIGGTKAIDIEKIMELKPDLIIANKEENVKEQVEALAETFPVWITDVTDLNGALGMIKDIGQLTGTEEKAESLITQIKEQFSILNAELRIQNSTKAAYLIWKDPYMTVGGDTFINSMMEAAGYKNIFAGSERYPEIEIADLQSAGCQLLILSSEPYPFSQKHITELQQQLPGTKIILADGEMFSWYGSRLLLAPLYFKELLLNIPVI